MGGCIVKDRRKNQVRPALFVAQVFYTPKISEPTRKQLMHTMFQAKDSMTPILHLKDSLLYQRRIRSATIETWDSSFKVI